MTQKRSAEVMRTYLEEVVGKRRLELIPQLAAEDMVDHTQPVRGRQGLVNHVENFHRTFPDVTSCAASAFHWRCHGWNR